MPERNWLSITLKPYRSLCTSLEELWVVEEEASSLAP